MASLGALALAGTKMQLTILATHRLVFSDELERRSSSMSPRVRTDFSSDTDRGPVWLNLD